LPWWSVEEQDACFVEIDNPSRALAHRNKCLS